MGVLRIGFESRAVSLHRFAHAGAAVGVTVLERLRKPAQVDVLTLCGLPRRARGEHCQYHQWGKSAQRGGSGDRGRRADALMTSAPSLFLAESTLMPMRLSAASAADV